jgi:hypothetical protein
MISSLNNVLTKIVYDSLIGAGLEVINSFFQSALDGDLDTSGFSATIPIINQPSYILFDAVRVEYFRKAIKWPTRNLTCHKACIEYVRGCIT